MLTRTVLIILLLARSLLSASEAPAEPPFERGLDKLRLELMAARSGLCALAVAAHPDDEDGATIAYLRRVLGVEVHMCLATRGEGGQNEVGSELGAALGWKRTQETESAARVLGAKVWYLNLPDFGYSKSAEETLNVWGQDEALGRLVRVIRTVRPDLLFTNHNPDGVDHGHHVACAKLLWAAVDAAGDAQRFPEQISDEGLKPWTPSALYRRLGDFERDKATLRIDVSQCEPSSGHSPLEISAWALEKHVSQGMKREVTPGEKVERFFERVKTKARENTPYDEKGMTDSAGSLTRLTEGLDELRERYFLPGLLDKRKALALAFESEAAQIPETKLPVAGPSPSHLQRAVLHFEKCVSQSLGLLLEARADDDTCTAGQEVSVTVRFANTGRETVTLTELKLTSEPGWELAKLESPQHVIPAGTSIEVSAKIKATAAAMPNFPYERFMNARMNVHAPVQVAAKVAVKARAQDVTFDLEPVAVPLALAPPYEARCLHDPVLVFDDPDRKDEEALLCRTKLLVTNHRRGRQTLYVKPVKNERAMAQETGKHAGAKLEFTEEGQTLVADLVFHAPVKELALGDLTARVLVWAEGEKASRTHLITFRRVPIKLPVPLNVGVVRTYDTATWDALKLLSGHFKGLGLVELKPADFLESDLTALHTIVLDIRATQYRPDVVKFRERLKEFMDNGGNVVCFYQKDFDWNESSTEAIGRVFFRKAGGGGCIAPLPLTLSFQRVTDEQAPLRILKPGHSLLARPNRIWDRDFVGWVQERGVYFPTKWDEKYSALLSSNDPGAPALDGGLLVTDLGKGDKGSFIYTSYVWYRQLRAGVPGAYRMLANLIAYPKVK